MPRRPGLLVALLAGLALLLSAAPAGAATAPRFAPSPHKDAADTPASPLDLTTVTFGQQDTWITLDLTTTSAWRASDLSTAAGRTLCVTATPISAPVAPVRLCVGDAGGHAALFTTDGAVVDALVARADDHSLQAQFSPLAAGLPWGAYTWRATSSWTGGAGCATACVDAFPDAGAVPDSIGLIREPPCFGAAARDASHPCANAALRKAVVPTPENAILTPNAFCSLGALRGLVAPCAFGVDPAQATSTFALIGDSHAQHWRGALEVVAQAQHWHGISVTRSSCPFNAAHAKLRSDRLSADCARWNRQVRSWLTAHPEIRTVFLSANAADHYRSGATAGFRKAITGLPATVHNVFVLRDTPATAYEQGPCVDRARAHQRLAGPACAQPRSIDVLPDPQAKAANALGGRAHVLDLNDFMCNARLCFPVVGGALVRKDVGHLTRLFSTTLGPYVLRDMQRVLQHR